MFDSPFQYCLVCRAYVLLNLRGFAASVIGTQFVAYAALDSLQDAQSGHRNPEEGLNILWRSSRQPHFKGPCRWRAPMQGATNLRGATDS
jgi:hypothetical protein